MQLNKYEKYFPFFILALGICFYFPFLGNIHLFDWDEINFAESAREMLLTGNYSQVQIDFKPFWEKPPLFFWLQAGSMHLFGVNEFAARFPNAVVGCITLLVLYFLGKSQKNATFGLIWALIYLGSFTPHLYFKSGIIDPTFNLFIFLGIYFIYKVVEMNKNEISFSIKKYAVFSGFFIGLAVLTKGPVAGLICGLTVFFYWVFFARFKSIFKFSSILIFGIAAFTIASLWFANELITNGIWFLKEFLVYQISLFSTPVAGHGQPFYYHFLVVLFGCFPMSVLAFPALFKRSDNFGNWMKITFWVVMILFSITTTKIVHYSSMAYFPLSYIAATFLFDWVENRINWPKWLTILLILIGFIISFLLFLVPYLGKNISLIAPFIKDIFTLKNLEANVQWNGTEMLIGMFYCLIILIITLIFTKNKSNLKNYKLLFISMLTISTATAIMLFGAFVVPKIEQYSQGAAIEFYESKKGQDVYIEVLGFKSYAHLFYFQKQPKQNPKSRNIDWLMNGKVDKPVFFVSKVGRESAYENNPNLKVVYEKNGFVFLTRK